MPDELSLFGEDDTGGNEPRPPVPAEPLIAGWQVDLLRKALDERNLTSMAERQAVIEREVGRPVASLRDLTHREGMAVLAQLGDQRSTSADRATAWDERDEDTWIDRL